ncbi:speckle-type POZ protein-like [Cotesia typhae]|uniref:speckle-type POZ protein-like n=1 Tax=Cotesia typhae TaxID=2053667 RepID=UPI003D69D59C
MKKVGYSYSAEHSIVYEWKINGITSFLDAANWSEKFEEITSPAFSTGAKMNDSWYLQLLKSDSDSSNSKSRMTLYLHSTIDTTVRAMFAVFILNNKKERLYMNLNHNLVKQVNPKNFQYGRFFSSSIDSWGFINFAVIDELLEKKDEILPNDILTVCVNLTVYDDYLQVDNSINLMKITTQKLSEDFEKLLISKKNSDVVIFVGDNKFDAHRFILTTRSCVFEAMFSYDTKEKKENEVTITDIDGEIFEKLLEYIYTDKVEYLDIFAEELLEASDKYQLQGLKEMCEDSLAKTVSIENAIRIIILADCHNAKHLKKFTMNYAVINLPTLTTTEDYGALKQFQPFLARALVQKYADGIKTN